MGDDMARNGGTTPQLRRRSARWPSDRDGSPAGAEETSARDLPGRHSSGRIVTRTWRDTTCGAASGAVKMTCASYGSARGGSCVVSTVTVVGKPFPATPVGGVSESQGASVVTL